ncbi:hypothetical protein [Aquifex sp.]
MKAKKSVLQLKSINIESEKIEVNLSEESIREINPEDYSVDLDFDVFKVKDKENIYLIKLFLKVNHSRKANYPFRAALNFSALFTFLETIEEEKRNQYILYNGLSILYGFARGYLFSKLDMLLPEHRIIPTVNLVDIIRKKMRAKK